MSIKIKPGMSKILEAIYRHDEIRFKDLLVETGLSATALTTYLKELVKYTLVVKNENGSYSKSLAFIFQTMDKDQVSSLISDPSHDKYDTLYLSGYRVLSGSSKTFFTKLTEAKGLEDFTSEEINHLNLFFSYIVYTLSYGIYNLVDIKDSDKRFNETKEYLNNMLLPILIMHSNLFRTNLKLSRELLDSARNQAANNLQEAVKMVLSKEQLEKINN
jgi:hypothetical protein